MYKSNCQIRTADRVYLQMAVIPCHDFDDLFEGVRYVRWQDWFTRDVRVIIDKVRVKTSRLASEHSIQSVVHKAIYDCLGRAWGMELLPETGNTATIRVYIENDIATVLLDLSGRPLHRRGYRTTGGEAPIRETLAAILLHMMQWRRKTPLHDAFCGSGTIPVEAVLYAHDIAPGPGRNFALGQARQNVGIDARIPRPDCTVSDFQDLAAPYDKGLLLSNPPYGERLGDRGSAAELYSSMHTLFNDFPGWEMGFITNHEEFESAIGRKADKVRPLKSGNLETKFYSYR